MNSAEAVSKEGVGGCTIIINIFYDIVLYSPTILEAIFVVHSCDRLLNSRAHLVIVCNTLFDQQGRSCAMHRMSFEFHNKYCQIL